jgi:hypothetical protein
MIELSSSLRLRYLFVYDLSTTPETSFRFGLFPFRSPLLRKSIFLSLPSGTEMFQFPECVSIYLFIQYTVTKVTSLGFPIRKSPDLWLFAPTRSLSQLIASFFDS